MVTPAEKASLIEDARHLFIARSHPERFRRDPIIIEEATGLNIVVGCGPRCDRRHP
jgi:hypothetical protein